MLVTTLVALGRGTHNTHTHTHTHTHTPSCCLTCTRLAVPYRETVIEISTGSLPSSRSAVAERMASICRQPGTHQQQVQRSLAVPQEWGWPGPYVYIVYECKLGEFCAKNTVCTPYIYTTCIPHYYIQERLWAPQKQGCNLQTGKHTRSSHRGHRRCPKSS